MLCTFPESLAYGKKLRDTDLAYLFSSEKELLSPKWKYAKSKNLLGIHLCKHLCCLARCCSS